jgi:very-short-patch-repair endonuclease
MYAEQPTHQKMADLATRQYGVVTRRQLIDLGHTESAIADDLEAGRLRAWNHSVFAVGDEGLSPHGLCMATVLFRGKGVLISHQSAVWLWGLETKLEVPVRASWALREEDVAETERLPVTAVPRTLLDYAGGAKRWKLERAIVRADRLGLLDLAAMGRITDERPSHRGRDALRREMVAYTETGFSRPSAERSMMAALGVAGVRRPAVKNSVEGYELDFFWGPERLGVELDSWEEQQQPRRSFAEERERRESLASAGVETLRITGTRLRREPRKVADRIAEQLDRRRTEKAA